MNKLNLNFEIRIINSKLNEILFFFFFKKN